MFPELKTVNGTDNSKVILLAQANPTNKNTGSVADSDIDKAINTYQIEIDKRKGSYKRQVRYIIKQIPLLMMKGGSDRTKAINLCKQIIDSTLKEKSYYKGMAKIYLADAYLQQMNEGKMETTSANIKIAMDYCTIDKLSGKNIVLDPDRTIDADDIKEREDLNDMFGDSGDKGKPTKDTDAALDIEGTDYYAVYLADSIETKLRFIRKGALDSDETLSKRYSNIITNIDSRLTELGKIVSPTEKNKIEISGLKTLRETASMQLAALATDNQDVASVDAAILSIDSTISGFSAANKYITDNTLEVTVKGAGNPMPKDSFDYASSKLMLADLIVKHCLLTGETSYTHKVIEKVIKDGKETLVEKVIKVYNLSDALDIYKSFSSATFIGSYPYYIQVQAKLGQINYAIAFNKLDSLQIGVTPYADKKSAINAAITYIETARGSVPGSKYLGCQLLLAEANLLNMRLAPNDATNARTLCDNVITYSNSFTDNEAKYDMQARAYLIRAKAILYDDYYYAKIEPEDVIKVSNDAAADIVSARNMAENLMLATGGKKKIIDEKKYMITGSTKKMDESFNADIDETEAFIKLQKAQAYMAMYYEALEIAKRTGGTAKAQNEDYSTLFNEAIALYKDAYKTCVSYQEKEVLQDKKLVKIKVYTDKSEYDRTIRASMILQRLSSLYAGQVDIRPENERVKTDKNYKNAKTSLTELEGIDISTYGKTQNKDLGALPPVTDESAIAYINSQNAIETINKLARQCYLVNNQAEGTYSADDKKTKISGYCTKIDEELAKISLATLTEGESKFLYATIVSVNMIKLGFIEDESERTALLNKIEDYCYKALNLNLDGVKKDKIRETAINQITAKAEPNTKAANQKEEIKKLSWMMMEGVADALFTVGLVSKDNQLIEVVDKFGFLRLIGKRNELRSAKICFNHANKIIWTTIVKNPQNLTKEEIEIFEKARTYYKKAVDNGYAKKDLNVLVNQQQVEFILASGNPVRTKKQLKDRAALYLTIASELDKVIKIDLNATENSSLIANKQKRLTNEAAVLKARLWKYILMTSCGDIAKIQGQQENIKTITGVDITRNEKNEVIDLNTVKGVKDAQVLVFNKIKSNYDTLETAIKAFAKKYQITDPGLSNHGIDLLSFNISKGSSYAILATVMNDQDTQDKAETILKKAIDDASQNTPLRIEAQIALANLYTWRSVTGELDTAKDYLKEALDYYKITLKRKEDEIPMSLYMGYAQCLAMKVYTSKGKDSTSKGLLMGDPDKDNGLLHAIIKNSDTSDESWSYATLTIADMTLMDAKTNILMINSAATYSINVLKNEGVDISKVTLTTIIDEKAHKSSKTTYIQTIADTDKLIKKYTTELVRAFNSDETVAYYRKPSVIRALYILAVCEARMLTSIEEIKKLKDSKKDADKTKANIYKSVWDEAGENLIKIKDLLKAVDEDPQGPFFEKFRGEFATKDRKEIKDIAFWMGELIQSKGDNLGE